MLGIQEVNKFKYINKPINLEKFMITTGYEFHKIIEEVFIKSNKIKIIENNIQGPDKGYDFLIEYGENKYAVEIKAITSSFSKMQIAYNSIMQRLHAPNNYKKLLVLPINITEECLKNRAGIDYIIWSLDKLVNIISEITEDSERKNLFDKLDNFTRENLNITLNKNINYNNSNLLQEYYSIKKGEKGEIALQYEKVCMKIINAVFKNDIVKEPEKLKTKMKKFEYDGIAKLLFHDNCEEQNDFFRIIENYFNCRYIVFEFKNYKKRITQKEILLTSKYLYKKALRTVAIIFTHEGVDKNGQFIIDGLIREEGKIIIVLNDKDVEKLLESPEQKNKLLNEKLDHLLMNLDLY